MPEGMRYMSWSPEGTEEPKVLWRQKWRADKACKAMAQRFPGQRFFTIKVMDEGHVDHGGKGE